MKYLDKVNAKNLYLLFTLPDQRGAMWEKWALELDKLGDEQKIKEHWAGVKSYVCEYYIKNFINCLFSSDFFNKDTQHYADILKTYFILRSDDDFNENQTTLWNGDKQITIRKLSSLVPDLAQLVPQIFNARERNGRCHELAHHIVSILENNSSIVTGKVYGMSSQAGYYHSWVEFREGEEDYVIDATLNAVYNRADYYELMHAEPLSAVTNEQIEQDKPWLKQLSDMGYKQYLIFRDEFARELDKKPTEFWENE